MTGVFPEKEKHTHTYTHTRLCLQIFASAQQPPTVAFRPHNVTTTSHQSWPLSLRRPRYVAGKWTRPAKIPLFNLMVTLGLIFARGNFPPGVSGFHRLPEKIHIGVSPFCLMDARTPNELFSGMSRNCPKCYFNNHYTKWKLFLFTLHNKYSFSQSHIDSLSGSPFKFCWLNPALISK